MRKHAPIIVLAVLIIASAFLGVKYPDQDADIADALSRLSTLEAVSGDHAKAIESQTASGEALGERMDAVQTRQATHEDEAATAFEAHPPANHGHAREISSGTEVWYGYVSLHWPGPVCCALSVMEGESGGDPSAVSSAGAAGLFQLMPVHWEEAGYDPFDPETNILIAARLYAQSGWDAWDVAP